MKRNTTTLKAKFFLFCSIAFSNVLKAQTFNLDAAVNSITVSDLLTPDNYSVTETIRNYGVQTINSITLSWRVNGRAITQ